MADISKITLPNGQNYNIKDSTARNAANSAVPNTRTVNGKALSSNISLGAGDVGAYTKSETDTKINAAIASAYKYKGSVTADKLPTSGQVVGDVYNITNDSSYGKAGMNVAWNGTTWDALGSNVDLSNYVTTSDSRLSNARPASDVYAWAKAASKPSYSASEINGLGSLATKNSLSAGDVGAVSKSGDTMTGNLTAPSFQTGTGNANYFQCKKFRGEGDADNYYHAVDFGYAGHNQVDFYEYGGKYVFHRHQQVAKSSGDAIIGEINGNGFVGKVNGYTINADVPVGAKFTDTTYSNATTSVAGLMSPTDKAKLDGIDPSAITTNAANIKKNADEIAKLNSAAGDSIDEATMNFTSSDVEDGSATAWTSVPALASGEKHSAILGKVSQMFKNVRYLFKMFGTTDISGIGDGTATGAISALTTDLAKQWEKIYPVGSIYISANSTSPAELFGGTWEQIKDRFLLAAGDAYMAGSMGGEAQHTLTKDEMPSHRHSSNSYLDGYANSGIIGKDQFCTWVNYGTHDNNEPKFGESGAIRTSWVGGSKPHNNMPPYIAVYMWKRVA